MRKKLISIKKEIVKKKTKLRRLVNRC